MEQSQPTPVQAPITEFYLVGLRLDGLSERPDFYTFLLEHDKRLKPLSAHGRILMFTHVDLAEQALHEAGIEVQFRSIGVENTYLIDVARTLYLLNRESADPERVIANTLDFFSRSLTHLGIGVPGLFADALIRLGEHVEHNPLYGDFMQAEPFRREKAIDALRWCLGSLISVTRFITKP